jgi:hypothetical protein
LVGEGGEMTKFPKWWSAEQKFKWGYVHRAMTGIENSPICARIKPNESLPQVEKTTYDWNKVTCKKCLCERHNYE